MAHIKTDQKLGRTLGFFSVFAIGTGTMIGAGIFILPGIATSNAGPAAIFSFLLGGLITLTTALSMAELATGMPRAGGTYYFISRAMGPIFGTIIGIGAWLALVFKGSFALIGLAEYIDALVPVPILIIAVLSGIVLLMVNYRGAESSGSLQNGIVVGLFLILILFISKGVFNVETGNLQPFIPYGTSSIFTTTGLIFVSYLGITQLAAVSEEVKNPSRNLPLAFIASVVAVTILYVGIMFVVNGVLPLNDLVATETPLIQTAEILGGYWARIAIIFAGFFATISTANAAILSSSRFPFAMGRDKIVPQYIVDIHHKFGTPSRSIILTGLVMILFVLFFNVEQLAKLGSTFNALIFSMVNLSVIILRNVDKKWYKPSFRDPLYPFTQIFGVIATLSLIPTLGLLPLLFSLMVITAGIIWFVIYGRGKAQPEYNLLDMIDEDKIPQTINEQKKRVMVAIGNKATESDLIHLANNIGDEMIGLHINKIPPQTALSAARGLYNKIEPACDIFKEEFEMEVKSSIDRCKFIEVFSHDISESILTQAEEEKVNFILVGWHQDDRLSHYFDNITHQVISHARSHLGILKGYFPEDIKEIIVPFGGGESSQYAYFLARRLAHNIGAKVKLLRVVNPDIDSTSREKIQEDIIEQIQQQEMECECEVDYEILERFSITDALIETCNKSDFMILGDTNKRFKYNILGNIPDKVSRHSQGPLLLIKRYRQISKRGAKSYIFKKKAQRKKQD